MEVNSFLFFAVRTLKLFTFHITPNLIGTYTYKIQGKTKRKKKEFLNEQRYQKRNTFFLQNQTLTWSTELKTRRY